MGCRVRDRLGRRLGRAIAQRLMLPTEGSVVLGRSHDCGCVLGDPTVSRRHARLTHTESGWTLRDLASSNGTYLNGARITETAPVHPGDEVRLGSAGSASCAPSGTNSSGGMPERRRSSRCSPIALSDSRDRAVNCASARRGEPRCRREGPSSPRSRTPGRAARRGTRSPSRPGQPSSSSGRHTSA
jgi:hypothetical protein